MTPTQDFLTLLFAGIGALGTIFTPMLTARQNKATNRLVDLKLKGYNLNLLKELKDYFVSLIGTPDLVSKAVEKLDQGHSLESIMDAIKWACDEFSKTPSDVVVCSLILKNMKADLEKYLKDFPRN